MEILNFDGMLCTYYNLKYIYIIAYNFVTSKNDINSFLHEIIVLWI